MNAPRFTHFLPRAFSLVELILTITLLGVLASVFVVRTGSQAVSVESIKLTADVRQLNQMVNLYKADGGDLKSLSRVPDVLAKLKSFRNDSSLKSHTGAASGQLLDGRVGAELGSGQSGRPRAVWSPSRQRFEVATDNREGAFSFDFDPARSGEAGQVDQRPDPIVKYDGRAGPSWIWGSPAADTSITHTRPTSTGGTGETSRFNPNQSKTPDPGDGSGGSGGPGGGGDDGGDEPADPPPAAKLPTPNGIPPGGTYAYSSFPNSVTLTANGAPAGDSVLEYRVNGGDWQIHSGGAISISPQDKVEARNVPAAGVTAYTASDVSPNEYYRLVAAFSGGLDSATWNNAAGGSGMVSQITSPSAGTVTFTHGSTQIDLGNGEVFETGVANSLTFNRGEFNGVQPNTWFTAGTVSLLNGEIFNNSDARSVTLQLNFNLTDPPSQSGSAQVVLDLVNTANGADRMSSADIVRLANPNTDFTMTIGGVDYRLEVRWLSTDPSSGVVQSNGRDFLVFEGATASGRLQARFVSN